MPCRLREERERRGRVYLFRSEVVYLEKRKKGGEIDR